MRSQLHAQPYNPKRHTDKQVDGQKKNIRTFGYLGGIVWNERTGNLIDGHRRLKALDQLNKYDGSNDYPVKVEVVDFDEKEEKEQMTYMAIGTTRPDYELIARYLPDIDYQLAGIEPYDLMQIESFLPQQPVEIETLDDFIEPEPTHEEKKAAVKKAKKEAQQRAVENWQNVQAYVTISFADAEEKRMFCDITGLDENEMFIAGKDVLEMIQ